MSFNWLEFLNMASSVEVSRLLNFKVIGTKLSQHAHNNTGVGGIGSDTGNNEFRPKSPYKF